MAFFHRLRFGVREAGEERLAAELWSLGTLGLELPAPPETANGAGGLGLETAAGEVTAYFADPLPAPVAALDGAGWRRLGGELLASERLASRDWMEAYRRQAAPFALGRGLWIDPGEPEGPPSPPPAGRRLLRVPARQAFGTGSHASTRLAIELIESTPLAGRRVLDVGTGTGILAFAARLAGASAVVGLDRDLAAALLAAQNRRLNGIEVGLFAGPLAALRPVGRFDAALVNILPERILDELPELVRCLAPAATAVFSGILTERRRAVEEALSAGGLRTVAEAAEGEWLALRTVTGAAPAGAGGPR